ncbi:MAG TPA: GGDEF domain-containing protein [Candidatus Acidoferrales bacterium]|nr:GGDEF domain-containing protein [Candidatus Acidoferrales bacterium]
MEDSSPIKPDQMPPEDPLVARAHEIRRGLRKLEHRQWWMASSAMLVILLLTVGVASFAFPEIMHWGEGTYSFFLSQAVRGLIGLVLLFVVYTIYQQHLINKIRSQLADQVDSVAKVELLTQEVYKLAVLDPLTNLHNRRSGEQRLFEEIARSRRHTRPLTVLLLDLDGLKQCNDKFGHDMGDKMLRTFADRLKRAIRGSDLAVRLGGDEFMLILPECRAEEVRIVLNRVSGLEIECPGEIVPVTFACGWADYQQGETAQQLLKRADEALYADKRAAKEGGPRRMPFPLPSPAS